MEEEQRIQQSQIKIIILRLVHQGVIKDNLEFSLDKRKLKSMSKEEPDTVQRPPVTVIFLILRMRKEAGKQLV